MNNVSLVATAETIRQFHPDRFRKPDPLAKQGILLANFYVEPENCSTALGRWLANTICTTDFCDDGSRCLILLPTTAAGNAFGEIAKTLSQQPREVRTEQQMKRVFDEIERSIENLRKTYAAYSTSLFEHLTIQFKWPVFGSAAAQAARTPEAYFDLCAGLIRATGGVVVHAGLLRARLPESIARTMAPKAGGGDTLLRRSKFALETA